MNKQYAVGLSWSSSYWKLFGVWRIQIQTRQHIVKHDMIRSNSFPSPFNHSTKKTTTCDSIHLLDINIHKILFYCTHHLDNIVVLADKPCIGQRMFSSNHLLKLTASPMEFLWSWMYNPCSISLTIQAPDMLCWHTYKDDQKHQMTEQYPKIF